MTKIMRLNIVGIVISSALFCLCSGNAYAGSYLINARNDCLSAPLKNRMDSIEAQTTEFLNQQQSPVTGLVESFHGTSTLAYDLRSSAFYNVQDGVLDAQSFTYDSAIAAMAYLLSGHLDKTQKILSVYMNEFYREKGDTKGLCNCYRTDEVSESSLMAGVDGQQMHLGPAMWVSIAALHYSAATGDMQYLGFVLDMAKWARSQALGVRGREIRRGVNGLRFRGGLDKSIFHRK